MVVGGMLHFDNFVSSHAFVPPHGKYNDIRMPFLNHHAVLAGVEFIFFTLAGMGLCSGFALQSVLIIKDVFVLQSGVCTEKRPFLLFTPSMRGLRMHRKLGGETARTTDPNNIPDHRASCSAYKAGGKMEGRMFGVMLFVFPSCRYV